MREHGGVVHHAVRGDAHHQGQRAAEADDGGLDGVADGFTALDGLVVVVGLAIDLDGLVGGLVEGGKHRAHGLVRLGDGRGVDGLLREGVRAAEDGGAQEAGQSEDQRHVLEIGFGCHLATSRIFSGGTPG